MRLFIWVVAATDVKSPILHR